MTYPGHQMRPIASNINVPTQKIAKWLIQQFKLLDPPPRLCFEFHFVDKIKNSKITRNEAVSFDVKSLFPSIPIDKALELLDKWLESKDVPEPQRNMFTELAEVYGTEHLPVQREILSTKLRNGDGKLFVRIFC